MRTHTIFLTVIVLTVLCGTALAGDRDGRELSLGIALGAMGADINVRNEAGQTPLMRAAAKGYADMVQVLIQNGANPRLENNRGESAMTIALLKGYTRIAESLKMAETAHRAERRETTHD